MSEPIDRPRRLQDYTIEEKCALFDHLYWMSTDEFEEVTLRGNPFGLKDHEHMTFEAVFEGTLGNADPRASRARGMEAHRHTSVRRVPHARHPISARWRMPVMRQRLRFEARGHADGHARVTRTTR